MLLDSAEFAKKSANINMDRLAIIGRISSQFHNECDVYTVIVLGWTVARWRFVCRQRQIDGTTAMDVNLEASTVSRP